MCILLVWFIAYNDVPDLNLILPSIHFSDIVGGSLASEDQHTPFPRKPARWSNRRDLTSVIPLIIIFIIGTWFSLAAIPNREDAASVSPSRRQIVFLHTIPSDH